MHISGAIALVTGANRGLGRQFATQLLERGATKVYATARRPELVDTPGVEVLPLDITDPASVAAAVAAAGDVNLLVNNAGAALGAGLVTGDLDQLHREMDTNYWGTLSMIRAFAPQLAGGAILNVLSVLSWIGFQGSGGYAASKSAQWALTNGVRLELADQGTQVTGLHLGAADTDMTAGYDVPKAHPAVIVKAGLDGLEAGHWEVLADEWSRVAKAGLSGDPRAYYSDPYDLLRS
ncbi:SDR family oxidoreductase [Paractinoplanes brasiliensis]|uniref:NADP-dependent 3-hydroxy acid dehydrogenase YdfG n=1 Tax=Paractinoplanes brasiliensis TaxID=52695 RepID=A0A4R6K2E9_9ACTN|nr:SDR family oxidoreductase [Actinoplanes brasiliensis]TDO41335.1 NADP-dependent 3-hydroxy acid dehydrogenase YdfG [Actinoplanes brasiliensis]GID27383.1 short-chain dehydrogenase [Actinoplanes brasiliensis]